VDAALAPVEGRSDLPPADKIDLKTLGDIPCGLLKLEAHVEQFFLEPLVRLLSLPSSFKLVFRQPVGPRVADYAITEGGKPRCIIEAKLRMKLGEDRNWKQSEEVEQARGYANPFKIPFMLVDCEEVFCFRAGERVPFLGRRRRDLTERDLLQIRAHVMGEKS